MLRTSLVAAAIAAAAIAFVSPAVSPLNVHVSSVNYSHKIAAGPWMADSPSAEFCDEVESQADTYCKEENPTSFSGFADCYNEFVSNWGCG